MSLYYSLHIQMFDVLPTEIIVDIASLLNSQAIDAICQVDKSLYNKSNDVEFWKAITEKKISIYHDWSGMIYSDGDIKYKPPIESKRDFFRLAAAKRDIFMGIEKYVGHRRGFIAAVGRGDIKLVEYFHNLDYIEKDIVRRASYIINCTKPGPNIKAYLENVSLTASCSYVSTIIPRSIQIHLINDDVAEVLRYLKQYPDKLDEVITYTVEFDAFHVFDALMQNNLYGTYTKESAIDMVIYRDAYEICTKYNSSRAPIRCAELATSEILIKNVTKETMLSWLDIRDVSHYNIYLAAKHTHITDIPTIMKIVSDKGVLLITVRQLLLNYCRVYSDVRKLIQTIANYTITANVYVYHALRPLRILNKLDWHERIRALSVIRQRTWNYTF